MSDGGDPESMGRLTKAGLFLLAILAGVARYLLAIEGRPQMFSWRDFFGHTTASAVAGIVTLLLCMEFGLSQTLTGAFVGIAGHMGTQALDAIRELIRGRYGV